MTNKAPTESIEQINLINWFRYNFPNVLIFAIPTGQLRNKQVAMKLKREGVIKGVSDLFIPEWFTWIEMKRIKGGVVSKEQKEFMAEMERVGYQCFVAKGFEEAKKIVWSVYNCNK